jgi:hypothetical protein
MGSIDLQPLNGFTAAYRAWSPEEETAALEMRAEGKTAAEISIALDRSMTSIETCLRRLEDRRSKPRKPRNVANRPCLCCGKQFASEGAHNRLCYVCRRLDVSPYAL